MSARALGRLVLLPLALAACDGGVQSLGWTFAPGPNDSSLPGDTFLPWAGGPAYYRRWTLGPSSDPSFFPVAVWLQSPPNAAKYAAVGVNTFTGLWMGPTDDQLAGLADAHMATYCDQSGAWSTHLDDPTIEAWMQPDGPDDAQMNASGGYDPCVAPATVQAAYAAFVASDPRRPVYLGLGRGVADTQWNGRGTCTGDTGSYLEYAKAGDLLAFHIYPHEDGVPIETVAQGVDNLLGWSEAKKPISATIEASDINDHGRPTPAELAAEVWMSLVHGAAGVQYFCHRFLPTFSETDCLDDAPTKAALAEINGRIRALAPVLNTPSVANGVTVSSSTASIPVDVMLKRQGGATYLFAVEMRAGATTATFTLRALPATASIEAIGEGRAPPATAVAGGVTFSDDFSGYGVHLYKITY
ncbi:MAG TPA: hypothetical protein VHL80_03145 [Polyangia bacterium]|nr:hypothetical protein [Polyangia bacterium]